MANISLFNTLFEHLDEENLRTLIEQKVVEKQNLEYKSESYGKDDESIREMLRDISSMANAYGGYLLLGIKESDDNGGIPIELTGVDNAESERDRIQSSCLANIEPHIPGLQIKPIPLSNNKSVLSIFIPRSTRAPHMITFRGLNQFWIRHDRQKSKMSIEEIRETFIKTENIIKDVRTFIQNRKAELIEELSGKPYYVISASPLLVREEIIDISDQKIRKILQNPPNQRLDGWHLDFGTYAQAHPTLNGLKIQDSKSVELSRNGYLEAMIHITEPSFIRKKGMNDSTSILSSYPTIEYVVSFIYLLKALREYLGIEEPFIISVGLFNIKGFGLQRDDSSVAGDYDKFNIWPKKELEIGPSQILFQKSVDLEAKLFVDRIWQAFEYEYAPYLDNAKRKYNFTIPD